MTASMSLVLTTVALLCCAANAQDTISYQALEPFTSIGSTVSYTGRIQASTNDSYGIEWIGPEGLASEFTTRVSSGSLRLEPLTEEAAFAESITGYYTITVPPASLSALRAYGNSTLNITGDTVNKSADFRTVSRSGGQTYLTNITDTNLELENRGGDIIVSGILQEVNYTNTGTGGLYLDGATQAVTLNLRAGGEVKINATGDIQIGGQAEGPAKVYYNRGSCAVSGTEGVCEQTTDLAIPNPLTLSTQNLTTAIATQG